VHELELDSAVQLEAEDDDERHLAAHRIVPRVGLPRMLCNDMLCYAMLCYAMLCYAMLCYAML
jgi:hypothetical protein